MASLNLADAKARLNERVERVEAGGTIDITRDGQPVAHLTAVPTPASPSISPCSNP